MFKRFVAIAILVFSLFIKIPVNAISTQWTQTFNGVTNSYDGFLDVGLDSSDNIYVVGVTSAGITGFDGILKKYNSAGSLQWTQTYNSPANSDDRFDGIAVDAAGNSYVIGSEFRPDTTQQLNLIVQKYDTSGLLQWTTSYNSPGNGDDAGFGAALDSSNNIWVTGLTRGISLALRKYSSTGLLLYTTTYNSVPGHAAKGSKVAIDDTDNVYVAGFEIRYDLNQNINILLKKYDNSGNELWTQTYNNISNGPDFGLDVATFESSCAYVTGYEYNENLNQQGDILLLKYDANGLLLRTTTYNDAGNGMDIGFGATTDASNNVWVVGTENRPDISQSLNVIMRKYTAAGLITDTTSFHSGANRLEGAQKIKLDSSGNLIVVGFEFLSGELINGWVKKFTP